MNKEILASILAGIPAEPYAAAIERHMEIVSDLVAHPPKGKFRGELNHEKRRRQYWQQKTGKRYKPWDFICAYPMLSRNLDACFPSREDAIYRYFGDIADAGYKADRKKYHKPRDPRQVYLPAGKMVPVRVVAGKYAETFKDRRAFLTALHPEKGYRVTVWPEERWKDKIRRWLPREDIEATGERSIPTLPKSPT